MSDPRQRDTRQPFTVLLPDGPRKPVEIHDNEVGLVMALVDKANVQALGDDWNAVGSYILLGTVNEAGRYDVYVGKSPMGLRSRLMEHGRSRNWTRALLIRRVVLHGFTSSQAGWLEGDLYDLFSAAERARVENQVTPRDDTVPPYELRMLRSLRDPIVRVLRMLGYETESAPEVVEPPQEVVAGVSAPEPAKDKPGTAQPRVARRARAAFKVSIANLLSAGLLRDGQRLISTSNAWPATATVNADATITWDQYRYPSASSAASAVCEGSPVNGWDFWAVETDGETTRLSALRNQYLDRSGSPAREPGRRPWSQPPKDALAPRYVSIRNEGPRKPRTELGVSLSDLMGAGLLRGGDELVSTDPTAPAEAMLGYDGTIVLDGTTYGSPSTAAQAVKQDRNTNGWLFWAVREDGDDVRLDVLRRRHLGLDQSAPTGRSRVSNYGVEMAALMDAGLVSPGDLLVSTSRSYPAVAYIGEDGQVVYEGAAYPSPSAAAGAVRGGKATNGWDFWALEGAGRPTRLSDVRSEYLDADDEDGGRDA